ncbi:MAG: ribonuclease P protein component [Woeseiales bacterium]
MSSETDPGTVPYSGISAHSHTEFAFTRERRLLKGIQFNYVFAQPRRSSDHYFSVLVRANNCACARLGLAIGKKKIRLSVARNRVKRLIRESFRHHTELLGAVDVIVLSRFDGNADNASLSRSLLAHWTRLSTRQR